MNNSYILLRNNIESSSLSFDELKQIGLQETDLVCVECQSVCWQNPVEIPELKKLLNTNLHQLKSTIQKESAEDINEAEVSPQHHHKKKHVFVELQAGKVPVNEKKSEQPGEN
jgi:hypothetical protein